PHHQHQTGAHRRLRRIDPAARPLRRARNPGLAWRDARIGDRPRRQYPSVHAAELHASRRRAASKRYFSPDLIEPPIEVAADGTIAVPTGPGLGVSIRLDRLERATVRATPDFRLQTSHLR